MGGIIYQFMCHLLCYGNSLAKTQRLFTNFRQIQV